MEKVKDLSIAALVFAFLGLSSDAFAQTTVGDYDPTVPENPIHTQPRGRNLISCSAYEAIAYNGYTVAQIDATGGEADAVQQLWGSYTSVGGDAIIGTDTYNFGTNRVSFREGVLRKIVIKNSGWPLTVLGKTVSVGESFAALQQKFGSDLKIIHKPDIDSDYSVSFGCYGNDYDGLLIDLDAETNKVVEIIYFVNP